MLRNIPTDLGPGKDKTPAGEPKTLSLADLAEMLDPPTREPGPLDGLSDALEQASPAQTPPEPVSEPESAEPPEDTSPSESAPDRRAPTQEWQSYVIRQGMPEAKAHALTRRDIVAWVDAGCDTSEFADA